MKEYTINVLRKDLIDFLSIYYGKDLFIELKNIYFPLYKNDNELLHESYIKTYQIEGKVEEHLKECQEVFENIKVFGIKDPVEILIDTNEHNELIKREGIYYHGFHRLAIAIILNIPTLKVTLKTDNDNLINLSEILFNIYKEDKYKYTIYQHIEHKFFKLFEKHNPNIENKCDAIIPFLLKEDVIVDFGCNNGFVTRKLMNSEFTVTGIDIDNTMFNIQKYLTALDLHTNFVHTSLEEYIKTEKFDTVIALSILHHYFKPELKDKLDSIIIPFFKSNIKKLFLEVNSDAEMFYIAEQCGYDNKYLYYDKAKQRTLYLLTPHQNKKMSEIQKYENPLCNFCKTNNTIIIAKNNNGIYDFGNIKKESFFKEKFDFVECEKCGLRYFTPRYTEKYLYAICGYDGDTQAAKERADLYFQSGAFGGVPAKGYTVETQKQFLYNYYGGHLKLIESFLDKKIESLFEIGCSVGFTLETARQHGVDYIEACDCDYHSVLIAKEQGFKVEHTFYRDFIAKRKYDVILSYNCIEHTFTPNEDIKKTYDMLEAGGIFLIHTFFEDLDVEKTMFTPCGHWYHFFEKTLKDMLESVGFKILKVTKSSVIGFFICKK